MCTCGVLSVEPGAGDVDIYTFIYKYTLIYTYTFIIHISYIQVVEVSAQVVVVVYVRSSVSGARCWGMSTFTHS